MVPGKAKTSGLVTWKSLESSSGLGEEAETDAQVGGETWGALGWKAVTGSFVVKVDRKMGRSGCGVRKVVLFQYDERHALLRMIGKS